MSNEKHTPLEHGTYIVYHKDVQAKMFAYFTGDSWVYFGPNDLAADNPDGGYPDEDERDLIDILTGPLDRAIDQAVNKLKNFDALLAALKDILSGPIYTEGGNSPEQVYSWAGKMRSKARAALAAAGIE
jgi:hypothetical protein